MEPKFYVYTLAYPDGKIFYVGKGTKYSDELDRIDDHERQAHGNRSITNNPRKIETIRGIWAQGGEVVKNKVAFFADEKDAYIYEWGLINATCFSEDLTNIHRAAQYPRPTNNNLPTLAKPICIGKSLLKTSPKPLAKEWHQVVDLEVFWKTTGINAKELARIVKKEIKSYKGYRLLDCIHT